MPRFGRARNRPLIGGSSYLIRLFSMCGLTIALAFLMRSHSRNPSSNSELDREFGNNLSHTEAIADLGSGVFLSNHPPELSERRQEPAESPESVDSKPSNTEVNQQLLSGVLDKTARIPSRAYYHLVTLAARAKPDDLQQRAAPESEITLAHLVTEPDAHRGKLVFLSGRLRGLIRFDATSDESLNPARLKTLYQGDLFTSAAHPYPYVIIIPNVPDGMPLGKDLAENVKFAGYFLKLWRYKTAGADRAAPLLIGRLISWSPVVDHQDTSRRNTYVGLALFVIIAGICAAAWVVNRSGSRARQPAPGNAFVKEGLARLEHTSAIEVSSKMDPSD